MTLSKTIIMKFINKRILLTLLFITSTAVFAQPKKVKVDGVVGVVGDYVVLDSDIDLDYITLKAQGVDVKNITRCELFGKQLEDRLYAHHAIQDSIIVTDAEVNSFLNEQLDAAVEQIGSIDKVVKYYNKKNVEELRSHFFDAVKMNKLTDQQRTAYTLSKVESYSTKEIAEILAISISATEGLIKRAKQKLLEVLKKKHEEYEQKRKTKLADHSKIIQEEKNIKHTKQISKQNIRLIDQRAKLKKANKELKEYNNNQKFQLDKV